MKSLFEIARGTVPGFSHVRAGKNNQDGFHVVQTADYTVAVVCDGCSGGKYSEAGAQFGALLLASTIISFLQARSCWMVDKEKDPFDWNWIRRTALWEMRHWAESLGMLNAERQVSSSFVNDYLLFTSVCAVITNERSEFASIGDGCISINGETQVIGPFEGNMPPYLGYGLVRTSIKDEMQQFVVSKALPTRDLESFMIGSDGIASLIQAEDKPFPGKTNLVGPISQLWTDNRFFLNADSGRRHLVLANGGLGSRLQGLLEDDTTFISGRKVVYSNA